MGECDLSWQQKTAASRPRGRADHEGAFLQIFAIRAHGEDVLFPT